MRRFILGAVSAALILGVAATAEAQKRTAPTSDSRATRAGIARYQLTKHFVVPTRGLILASTLSESLAARAPSGPARPREQRIDLDGRAGMRRSLAMFVDRTAEAPRATRLRLALPGGEGVRPTFFTSSGFDPWRGPAVEAGPGKKARMLGAERRFEERQGRFATATTGRAGISLELGK